MYTAGLDKDFGKRTDGNWPLDIPSLVFAYKAMPQSITVYQPYKLILRHKTPAVCNSWLGSASYNSRAVTTKCAWVNQKHELLMSANRQASKHIKQSAKKSQTRPGGKPPYILVGNLVLLRDHQTGQNKIQDNYRSKLFVGIFHHQTIMSM